MIEDDYDVEPEDDQPDIPTGAWVDFVGAVLLLLPILAGLVAMAEVRRFIQGVMSR